MSGNTTNSSLGGGKPGAQPQLLGGGANSNSGSGMVGSWNVVNLEWFCEVLWEECSGLKVQLVVIQSFVLHHFVLL